MTTLIQALRQGAPLPRMERDPVRRRGAAVAALIAVTLAVPGALPAAVDALAEAWLAVSVFVAATIALLPGRLAHWLGVAGALLALAMWVMRGGDTVGGGGPGAADGACAAPRRRVIDDTNFVTAWAVFAFVGYELLVHASGVDLGAAMGQLGALVPLMAVAIGFVPGCGPQIVVTTLYLAGTVPMSAQLGNAIANDGDALFPAIAVAPRAALVATLYSGVPALVVAYGWFWLAEGGGAV